MFGNCESPIEETFAYECSKYLNDGVSFDSQLEVTTGHGGFRIDFVLSQPNQRVAVECDGQDFHEPFRDEFRDAILLGEGHFDTIYHFRGCDIFYFPEDCLWIIAREDPPLFSDRGRLQLNQLHKLEIIPILSTGESRVLCDWTEPLKRRMRAFRRNRYQYSKHNPAWPHWKTLYRLASQHPYTNLDQLLALEKSQWVPRS